MGSPTRLRYYRTHTVASSEKEKQDQKNANESNSDKISTLKKAAASAATRSAHITSPLDASDTINTKALSKQEETFLQNASSLFSPSNSASKQSQQAAAPTTKSHQPASLLIAKPNGSTDSGTPNAPFTSKPAIGAVSHSYATGENKPEQTTSSIDTFDQSASSSSNSASRRAFAHAHTRFPSDTSASSSALTATSNLSDSSARKNGLSYATVAAKAKAQAHAPTLDTVAASSRLDKFASSIDNSNAVPYRFPAISPDSTTLSNSPVPRKATITTSNDSSDMSVQSLADQFSALSATSRGRLFPLSPSGTDPRFGSFEPFDSPCSTSQSKPSSIQRKTSAMKDQISTPTAVEEATIPPFNLDDPFYVSSPKSSHDTMSNSHQNSASLFRTIPFGSSGNPALNYNGGTRIDAAPPTPGWPASNLSVATSTPISSISRSGYAGNQLQPSHATVPPIGYRSFDFSNEPSGDRSHNSVEYTRGYINSSNNTTSVFTGDGTSSFSHLRDASGGADSSATSFGSGHSKNRGSHSSNTSIDSFDGLVNSYRKNWGSQAESLQSSLHGKTLHSNMNAHSPGGHASHISPHLRMHEGYHHSASFFDLRADVLDPSDGFQLPSAATGIIPNSKSPELDNQDNHLKAVQDLYRDVCLNDERDVSRYILVRGLPVQTGVDGLVMTNEVTEAMKRYNGLRGIYIRHLSYTGCLILSFFDLRHAATARIAINRESPHEAAFFYKQLSAEYISRTQLAGGKFATKFVSIGEGKLKLCASSRFQYDGLKAYFSALGDLKSFELEANSSAESTERVDYLVEFYDDRSASKAWIDLTQVENPELQIGWQDEATLKPHTLEDETEVKSENVRNKGGRPPLISPFPPYPEERFHRYKKSSWADASQSPCSAAESLPDGFRSAMTLASPPTGPRLSPDKGQSYSLTNLGYVPNDPSKPNGSNWGLIRDDPVPDNNLIRFDRIMSGEDKRTSCILRNLPNRMTQVELMANLDEIVPREYDFIYLRFDFNSGSNCGFGFLNFTSSEALLRFWKARLGSFWDEKNSRKLCMGGMAQLQGKKALVERFRNSSVMDQDPAYQPKIFYSSGPNQGRPEPFPLPNNAMRKAKSAYATGLYGLYGNRPKGGFKHVPL